MTKLQQLYLNIKKRHEQYMLGEPMTRQALELEKITRRYKADKEREDEMREHTTIRKTIEPEKKSELIELGEHYITDSNIVLIRCYGAGTSTYWVRDDDLTTAYKSLYNARNDIGGRDIYSMRRFTKENILDSLRGYLKKYA